MSTQHDVYDAKKDPIEIVSYNNNWPRLANEEIAKIRNCLKHIDIMDIQHVGSTAIPNLSAKPIIDIYIGASPSVDLQFTVEPITTLGYLYWDTNPDKDRLVFIKGMPPHGEKRTHHAHVVHFGSEQWDKVMVFRDYLLGHTDEILNYQKLKVELAQKYTFDRESYTNAKTSYIDSILRKAGYIKN